MNKLKRRKLGPSRLLPLRYCVSCCAPAPSTTHPSPSHSPLPAHTNINNPHTYLVYPDRPCPTRTRTRFTRRGLDAQIAIGVIDATPTLCHSSRMAWRAWHAYKSANVKQARPGQSRCQVRSDGLAACSGQQGSRDFKSDGIGSGS